MVFHRKGAKETQRKAKTFDKRHVATEIVAVTVMSLMRGELSIPTRAQIEFIAN
jgi:hypothetical protein